MTHDFTDKKFPANVDAERLVLGCILLTNDLYAEAAAILSADDFFSWANAHIFNAFGVLMEEGRPIDPTNLINVLEINGDLDKCGGPAYLAGLFDGVPRFSEITGYCRLVKEKATARRLIATANLIQARAFDNSESVADQIADAQSQIMSIEDPNARSRWRKLGEVTAAYIAKVEQQQESDKFLTGLATGITQLDYMTGGLQRADLIICGGRPSMGKSALAFNIAEGVAKSPDNKREAGGKVVDPVVAIFSMEMADEQLGGRFLSSDARVDSHRLRSGMLNKTDWRMISQSLSTLEALGVHIDDQAGHTVASLRAGLRELKREQGALDLVIVDYLQLMTTNGTGNAAQDYGDVAKGLKIIAKEFNVPVLVISSLSRACEARTDKRPMMSDLRESGAIEFHADQCWFVYRDAVYNQNADPNAAELIVRKQRNGPIGTVDLVWLASLAKFEAPFNKSLAATMGD